MSLVLRTKALGKHGPVTLLYGNNELFTVAPGRTIDRRTLEIAGDVAKLKPGDLRTEPKDALEVTLGKRDAAAVEVELRPKVNGAVILYAGAEPIGSIMVGTHQSHFGPGSVDLLAQASNGSDARRIVALQQILQNRKAPIIDQRDGVYGSADRLVCGSVVQRVGADLFDEVNHSGLSYHRPLPRTALNVSWANIIYDASRTWRAVEGIRKQLSVGHAVRVGVVYQPGRGMVGPNGALQPERSGGHSVLIVANRDNRFLYLDPFPQGSRTRYAGGLPVNTNRICDYMGEFGLTEERGLHLQTIVSQESVLGEMDVITGPLA